MLIPCLLSNKTNIKSLTGIQTNTVTYPANLSAEEDKDSLFLERIDADLLLKIEDKKETVKYPKY